MTPAHGPVTVRFRVTRTIPVGGLPYAVAVDSAARTVYVANRGIRYAEPNVMERLVKGEPVDSSEYYFCSTPSFETDAPDLQWLRQSIFLGIGMRLPNLVVIQVWRVL